MNCLLLIKAPIKMSSLSHRNRIRNLSSKLLRVALIIQSKNVYRALRTGTFKLPRQLEMNYYPTLFTNKMNLYDQNHGRISVLDLPFSAEDFNGVVFLDDF